MLGKTNPLVAGQHTVDYYKYVGTALDVGQPDLSYSWSVVAAATTPTTTTTAPAPSTATTTPAPSTTGSALPSLPYPVQTTMRPQASPDYNVNDTVTGSDGIVRLTPVTDPGGSGRQVYLHRIVRADANTSGTATNVSVRSEKEWIDQNQYMFPGNDYWFAFAFRPEVG